MKSKKNNLVFVYIPGKFFDECDAATLQNGDEEKFFSVIVNKPYEIRLRSF